MSVELTAWWNAARRVARITGIALLRRFANVREISALFAAIDALVRPKPFENKFRSARFHCGVRVRLHAERFQMIEEAGNFLELADRFRARSVCGHFQFLARLEKLHDRLEVHALIVLRERFADG